MPASKANQRAVNKYKKNNYDRIEITAPKGRRDEIKAHAEAQGESVNGFINRAISEAMERDGADPVTTAWEFQNIIGLLASLPMGKPFRPYSDCL